MGFHRGFVARNRFEADAPTWTSVSAGNSNIALSWGAPYSTAYTITGYEVEISTNLSTWSTPGSIVYNGTSAIVTSLTNGTTYYFRVRAVIGGSLYGKWSLATTGTVFGALPSAPAAPTTSVGFGAITVSWTAPAENGYAITDYSLQYSSDNGSNWSTAVDGVNTNTSYVFSGSNGTSYVFKVAAVNHIGTGPYSASSTAVTQSNVPAQIAKPSSSGGDKAFLISWTAPSDNGSGIDEYQIYLYENFNYIGSYTTALTSYAWSANIVNGRSYYAIVRAHNGRGYGAWSEGSDAQDAVMPSQPAPSLAGLGGANIADPGTRYGTIVFDPVNCVDFSRSEAQYSLDNVNWTVAKTVYSNGSDSAGTGNVGVGTTVYARVVTYNTDGTAAVSSSVSVTSAGWQEVNTSAGYSGQQTVSSNSYANNFDGTYVASQYERVNSIDVSVEGTDDANNPTYVTATYRQVNSNVVRIYTNSVITNSGWEGKTVNVSLSSTSIHNGIRTVTATGYSSIYGYWFSFSQTTTSVTNPVSASGTVRTPYYNTQVQSAARNFDLQLVYQADNSLLQNIECGIASLGYGVSGAGPFTSNRAVSDAFGRANRRIRILGNGSLGGSWPADERIKVSVRVNYTRRY
jgi:hypothetical protein